MILKKFDKKFAKYIGYCSALFIQSHIANTNSDLQYILSYKIVDEITAISEDLIQKLLILANSYKNLKIEKTDVDKEEYNTTLIESSNLLFERILESAKQVHKNIDEIEEASTEFRSNILDWNGEMKFGEEVRKNSVRISPTDNRKSFVLTKEDDNLLMKFISKKAMSGSIIGGQNFVNVHMNNLRILLLLTLASSILISMGYPMFDKFMEDFNFPRYYSAYLFGVAYFFAGFSSFIFRKNILRLSFKNYLLFSCFFLLVGSFLHCLAFNENSFYWLLISRITIGVGYPKIMVKFYILKYAPKSLIRSLSFKYMLSIAVGQAVGSLLK